MAVDLAHDFWQELKRFISVQDMPDAADTVINLLIDNDYDIDEIKQSFKGDNDIRKALQLYSEEEEEEADEEFDDYDEEY